MSATPSRFQRHHAIIGLMALVIAALAFALVFYARDELRWAADRPEEAIETASGVKDDDDGEPVVTVTPASQKASGILTVPLTVATARASSDVYGTVVNLQPLYELRGRYLAAAAEARALRSTVAASRAEYDRTRRLYEDDRNLSQRALQSAEAQWKSDLGRLQAAEQTSASLLDTMRATWGPTLTKWATEAGGPFAQLASQRSVLVQLAFPHDLQVATGRASVAIAPVSARGAKRSARYVSASPQVDAAAPGATHFYIANGEGLRGGMRIAGQLASGSAQEGVAVPEAAVVWHAGKAWAYVKEKDETFVRRLVRTDQEIGDAWFNSEGFEAGESVVVSGAQLLLSEELKFQIRNENED